jgi:hypothetical protein
MTTFIKKINNILNSDSRSVSMCVWKITKSEVWNLKRRTDPILKKQNAITSVKWRAKNRKRAREIDKKSYDTNSEDRCLKKRNMRLNPLHHERLKQIQRDSYKKHKKERNAYSKNKRDAERMLVLMHYSGGVIQCACCGELELEFLGMDHIHGRKKYNHKIHWGGSMLYRWLIKNGFPDGFRVLCLNCNFARSKRNNHDGLCPHERKRLQMLRIKKPDLQNLHIK